MSEDFAMSLRKRARGRHNPAFLALRHSLRLSQRAAAEKYGVSHSALQKYEQGEILPRPAVVRRILKRFGSFDTIALVDVGATGMRSLSFGDFFEVRPGGPAGWRRRHGFGSRIGNWTHKPHRQEPPSPAA